MSLPLHAAGTRRQQRPAGHGRAKCFWSAGSTTKKRVAEDAEPTQPKKRGRPLGSKNKPKAAAKVI